MEDFHARLFHSYFVAASGANVEDSFDGLHSSLILIQIIDVPINESNFR